MLKSKRLKNMRTYLGKVIDIKIDRPVGYVHKKEKYTLTYPINYGYIPGVLGGDGEEQDVYLLGIDTPVDEYRCKIIGIIHRRNDVEDKLVAAPEGRVFYQNEITEAVDFQEKYYITQTEALYEKSAGAVLYTVVNGEVLYLLIKADSNSDVGFPKGHVEPWETEKDAAAREIYEETSVKAEIKEGFRRETDYTMPGGIHKTVVYFTAEYHGQAPKHNEGFEHSEYLLLPFKEAYAALTFDNTKEILTLAHKHITQK